MKIFIIAETPQVARSLRVAQAAWRNALGLAQPEYVEISSLRDMRGLSINPDRVIISPTFHSMKDAEEGEEMLAYLNLCIGSWGVTHG